MPSSSGMNPFAARAAATHAAFIELLAPRHPWLVARWPAEPRRGPPSPALADHRLADRRASCPSARSLLVGDAGGVERRHLPQHLGRGLQDGQGEAGAGSLTEAQLQVEQRLD